MVVLSCAIVSKQGKALVARQFVDMSRIRIEGLLAAFPKLVGSGKQHTYVETENVRYLYQPLETMYLVLVTNKSSNILEDLEILRMCGKVVAEFVVPVDEETVAESSFDLLFAFDEVISLGYKDNVTVSQVRQNTEMESHEEKLHKMIIQSKINETKDMMKKKAQEIEKAKHDATKGGLPGMGGGGRMAGISSFGGAGSSAGLRDEGPSSFARPEPAPSLGFTKAAPEATRGPKKGMVLGKAKGAKDFLESLKAEGEVVEDVAPAAAAAGIITPVAPSDPVFIALEEKVSGEAGFPLLLNKDGGLENMEVQGSMSLQVAREEDAFLSIALSPASEQGYQFKTHPNIDKAAYARDHVLALKDPNRPFPTGAPLGVLKWRLQTRDEDMVPLTINCWPSVSGGESFVNIEYESAASFDLQRVQIVIPLPALHHAPQVNSIDGDWRFDTRKSAFVWSIELIDDTNRSGSAEFVVPAANPNVFFPIEVDRVESSQTGQPVKYGSKTSLVSDAYTIE
eukprot:scaffold17.g485.t1